MVSILIYTLTKIILIYAILAELCSVRWGWVSGFSHFWGFFRIFSDFQICYKMAKKNFFFLKIWKFFYIPNFEILAISDFHNFTISRFYFDFSFFGIFGFWRLRGKIDPHEKKNFQKKLCLKKLGFYMGIRISIDKERRKR